MVNLNGKCVLVTGGSCGIGAAIALTLAENGADVAFTYQRSVERAEAVVKSIESTGRRGIAIRADSADPDAITRSVSEAVSALGGLDILVNSTAISHNGMIADLNVNEYQAGMDVNMQSPVLFANAAIPHLAEERHIVTIGSASEERVPFPDITTYCEQSLSAEVARHTKEVRSLHQQLTEKEHLATVGTLAASIVHEIRNPLTTIWMWLDYCQHQDFSVPARKRLSLALADSERLQRLLNQILLYAKPKTLQLQEVNLIQLVVKTLDGLHRNPVTLNRQLEFWHSRAHVSLMADPDKLKQVLINLVTNACEAVSDGDRICIRVEAVESAHICLQIHNAGIPIPPEHLPQLTEPFFTTKATGTGLGLAIVQQIIEAHAGTLQIVSSASGGTTVTVTLPNHVSIHEVSHAMAQ